MNRRTSIIITVAAAALTLGALFTFVGPHHRFAHHRYNHYSHHGHHDHHDHSKEVIKDGDKESTEAIKEEGE